ncbi:hypothetical protein B0T10DRAFT_493745 [Thelonectria olida]|uniref:Aflatoxin regulatory protein domain-containing protein n=1 Tax=Thelonectria olida TaxID=1576542 RepID=A0A9P8VYE1_9HYPO|nr:hypothetical protein B0T10DRAFT_493745 [Thelonectria olida]
MGCDYVLNTAQRSQASSSYTFDHTHAASQSLGYGSVQICDTLPNLYLTPPHLTPPLVDDAATLDFEFPANLIEPLMLDNVDVLDFAEQSQFKVADNTPSLRAHALPDLPALSCWPQEQTTSSMPLAQASACPSSIEKCMAACLRILRALRGSCQGRGCLFSKGTASSSRGGRQLDAVLTANRYAMNTISRVLACPCLSNAAVQLILISICDKLRAWNYAILDCGAAKHDEGPCSSHDKTGTEKVGEQPFKVGDFSLDDGLAARFRAYLVREELQRLEEVVQRVVGRPAATAASPTGRRTSGFKRPLSESAGQDLGRLLRRRLQAARVTALGRTETAGVSWCT